MKKVILIAILSFVCMASNAQVFAKYQGEVNLGYSIGVGEISYNRVNLHTVQGLKMGDYFFAGVGLGLDWWRGIYADYWEARGSFDKGELAMPIYLNVKGYLPVSEKVSPYVSFDVGYAFGLTEGLEETSGFCFTPAVGVKFLDNFKAEIGFNLQKFNDFVDLNANAVKLSVGYIF